MNLLTFSHCSLFQNHTHYVHLTLSLCISLCHTHKHRRRDRVRERERERELFTFLSVDMCHRWSNWPIPLSLSLSFSLSLTQKWPVFVWSLTWHWVTSPCFCFKLYLSFFPDPSAPQQCRHLEVWSWNFWITYLELLFQLKFWFHIRKFSMFMLSVNKHVEVPCLQCQSSKSFGKGHKWTHW